ncbi:helix-turn-helix transcriptional regulator [Paenibacillus antri]|uniref:Helix-turn-helix transcriptional regulator n=1 Tax=Paenibacillus antri TaxID=2582848 RepID=A0A5R9G0W7_9BACL|nr:helix-turn-helix transcriptional regulator [Paenibacillus antri]TLS49421.1 helix-turn-helix transcriptional regulator [Paenibacillus antri]
MIGKNIQQLRAKSGITLSELAERAGISKSYLSSIERNLKQNPSIQVMEKIAVVLKVDLKTLLKMDMNSEKKQQLEREWMDFVDELKRSGIDKQQVNEYKILIEFIKWHNEQALYEGSPHGNKGAPPAGGEAP